MKHRVPRPWSRWAAVVLGSTALLAANPERSAAQVVGLERLVTADGVRLDFTADGVWRRKAARVAATRRRLKAQALFDALNAAAQGAPAPPAAAVSGTLRMPSVLLAFNDTETSTLPPAADYDALFYGDPPLSGRPYSLRTYYEELSHIDETATDLFTVDGQTYGWVPLADPATYYLDACAGANPLDCSTGRNRFGTAFREALGSLDGTVDFSQYDNDGPDGTPNSGDDDGVVDVVQFVQPVLGGECGGPGMWAHKSNLGSVGGVFTTDDPAGGGGFITVDSYYVVSGVGGPDCVPSTEIMAIGVSAHELGHGLGLPDLYDTRGSSSGIGEWGLMGSGGYTSLNSPAHYSAWSKEQMGWVSVRDIAAGGTFTVGPVVTSDTVFLIRPLGSDPRGEYLLLENKQPVLADTANLLTGGRSGPKLGGLLVWHVDSAKIAQSVDVNEVNFGSIHGVALVEADGNGALRSGSNRGNAGDPYPGSSGNLELSFATDPAALKNADGSFMGVRLDAFQQVVPDDEMQLRVTFGFPAVVFLDSSLAPATMGAPYIATLRAVGGLGAGTYAAEVLAGTLPAGVQLLSAADGAVFSGIPEMTGGFDVTVGLTSGSLQAALDVHLLVGAPALDLDRLVDQLFDGTESLTADEARFLDLLGNKNGAFDLGDFLAWVDAGYAVFTGAGADGAPITRRSSSRRVP
jgi:M6 family metalloprotease-like protein